MSGGGKSGSTVVGYWYSMGVHLALSHGPVDSVNRIVVGERLAWSGDATASQQINIYLPELFGGDTREGGVYGAVDIMMGEPTQPVNPYLAQVVNGGTAQSGVIADYSGLIASGGVSPEIAAMLAAQAAAPVVVDGSQVIYTMLTIPDQWGDVRYVVTRESINQLSDITETLIDTTYPHNDTAESDANEVFVRTSLTTSVTDDLTGIITTQTIVTIGNIPAFRGICSLVFRSFTWSALNPYFKATWVGVTRILKGWDGDNPWYPAAAQIGQYDMNPAHIIYQCMTDTAWGMGETRVNFDDAKWRAAADQLNAEGFGLSLRWTQQSTIKAFVQEICNHINATLRMNMLTGLFELVLIRDDYDLATLVELNVDNIIELTSFQRAAWGELAGEIVVTYTTRDDKPTSIAVQDPSAIYAQGGIVTATRDYPGIRNDGLAQRVALRDLQTASAPLAKVTLKSNRIMWDQAEGDVFKLNWAPEGITDVPFRIVKITKGSLTSGAIEIEAVEDLFGLPDLAYTAVQPAKWIDPVQPTHAVANSRVIEATYWDVVRNSSAANYAAFPSDYAFASMFATYGSGSSISYDLYAASLNTTQQFKKVVTGHYTPHALTTAAVKPTDTVIGFVAGVGIDASIVGSYAYLGDECVAVDAFDIKMGKLTVRRGILDTVPAAHIAGTQIWVNNGLGADITVYEAGETLYYRPSPLTSSGHLDVSLITSTPITLTGRAQMPYAPGMFQLNAQYYPTSLHGALSATWAHRDRTRQTITFNDYTVGNIGPEVGVTYTMKVYNGTTLLRTYAGITSTSWAYPGPDDIADGNIQTLRLTLESARGSLASWQKHDVTFIRHGLGFDLGLELGGVSA